MATARRHARIGDGSICASMPKAKLATVPGARHAPSPGVRHDCRVGVMRRCAPELDGIGSERPPAPGRRRRRVLAPHGRARPCACRRGSRPVLRPEPGGATGQAQAVRDTGWCSYVRGPARPALLRTAYMAWLGRGSELLGLRARSVFRDGGHMRETPSCLLLTASRAVLSNQTAGGGWMWATRPGRQSSPGNDEGTGRSTVR